MGRIDLAQLPPALAEHVPPRARLSYPKQGATSDVAFAEHEGRVVVVKRCAHPVYIDWLRREQLALRALAQSGLPIPRFIGYAEEEAEGVVTGWLVTSRLAGSPLFGVAMEAAPAKREALFRSLGEALRRLHALRVPPELHRARHVACAAVRSRARQPGWCDGTAAGLAELERSQPEPVPETLIHGDLALDNVLVDGDGAMSFIDWAGGGSGDPRHDIALALQNEPEFKLTPAALDAFYAGYGSAPVDDRTCTWFVRLYDYF